MGKGIAYDLAGMVCHSAKSYNRVQKEGWGNAYHLRSQQTSRLLGQLFEKLQGEGLAMSFTMEDFNRQYVKDHFALLPPKERQEVLRSLPPEERLAGLSAQQIGQYLDQLTGGRLSRSRKHRRKK